MLHRSLRVGILLLLAGAAGTVWAGDPNLCDELGEVPDVVVGGLTDINRYTTVDGQAGYSVATESCNIGSCWANWDPDTPDHPVIAQNLYRIKDGRFEQIGHSWLKHGFSTLDFDLCSNDCQPADGFHLGVNCSDPYEGFLNGLQPFLGPRWQINAFTGEFPYPFDDIAPIVDTLSRRIVVDETRLDPQLNTGAQYFIEGHYITLDDAQAGRGVNNASSRRVAVVEGFEGFDMFGLGAMLEGSPAIELWPIFATPGSVTVRPVQVPGEGRFFVAVTSTELPDGWWRYEYAVFNLNSHRAAGRFEIAKPFGSDVREVSHAMPAWHSGDLQQASPWSIRTRPARVEFFATPYEDDPLGNGLRWSSLHNFAFESPIGPGPAEAELYLWVPGGAVSSMTVPIPGPSACDNDGICEAGETCASCADCDDGGECCGDDTCDAGETSCSCAADCGAPAGMEEVCGDGIDDDCDGRVDCEDSECCGDVACPSTTDGDSDGYTLCDDCDDTVAAAWGQPSETTNLRWDADGATLRWDAPLETGGALEYEVIRAGQARQLLRATCSDALGTQLVDGDIPAPGEIWFYDVRAETRCPVYGEGPLGTNSLGARRVGRVCPD